MRIGILEPHQFSENALLRLKAQGDVSLYEGGDLHRFISDKDVLFIRLKYRIGEEFFSQAPQLKLLCSPTTGLNHIDLEQARRRKVKVISLQGEQAFLNDVRATPEHALGLVLALLRNYGQAFLDKTHAEWNREKWIGREIYQRQVGIIGLGRVGRLLAHYLVCLGAQVFFYENNSTAAFDQGRRLKTLSELITRSSLVVLCASCGPGNEKIIGAGEIDLLKDKYFVNISRGELVDEEYLATKIKEGHFRGVALDVIQNETGENRLDRLLELTGSGNVILTPHLGGATLESMHKTEEFIVEKLSNAFKGVPLCG